MNSWFAKSLFLTVALSLATILVIRFSPPISLSSVVTQKDTLFTVDGTGKVTVVPDTAIVDLGISVNKPTVAAAQTEANTVIKKVTDDVKSLGVEPKYMKTSNYSISPQYDYQSQPPRIIGYQVTATLTITVKDFDKINDVIDRSTADGANTVNGIQLTVDDTKQKDLLNQARQQAINEAKAKAASLAAAAGITLGRIVNVQETGSAPRIYPMMYSADSVSLGGAPAAKTSIQPGSTDITSTVTLSYETR
jgi:uncharacterized protein YggE